MKGASKIMDNKEIITKLAAPFSAAEVEWRIQGVDKAKMRGLAVPYIDSRAIQRRLDSVVGPFRWCNNFRQWHENSQICCVSILHTGENGNSEWVHKWDGAENSKIESVKGGLSDSFKRAAVLWGIGRYLYSFSKKWVGVEGKDDSFYIKQSEIAALDAFHDSEVERIFGHRPDLSVVSGNAGTDEKIGLSISAGTSCTKPSGKPDNNIGKGRKEESTGESSPETENLYLIKRRLEYNNDRGQSIQLELVEIDSGDTVRAYIKGSDEALVEGVKLKNTEIIEKKGTKRNYFILQSYEIAS
jgi:hypothetical protein